MRKTLRAQFHMALTTRRVMISTEFNKLIYALQRFPLIGRHIKDEWFGQLDGKTAAFIVVSILQALKKLSFKAAYVGLFLIFGSMLAMTINTSTPFSALNTEALMMTFFFLSFIGAPFAFAKSVNMDMGRDLMMLEKFRADAGVYVPARIYEQKLIDALLFLPYVFLLALTPEYTIAQGLLLLALLECVKLVAEGLLLFVFSFIQKVTSRVYKALTISMSVIGLAALVTPYLLCQNGMVFDIRAVVFHPAFMLGALALCILSVVYIQRYPYYRPLVWGQVVNYKAVLEKAKTTQKQRLFGDSHKWSARSGELAAPAGQFEHLTGYAYFNALLFYRHRKFFNRKILWRLAGILGVVLGIAIFLFFAPKGGEEEIEVSAYSVLPIFFFFSYLLSMGRVTTAAMFSNCDIAMLHYKFYRKRDVTLANFNFRLKKILLFNAPIIGLLALIFTGGVLLDGASTGTQLQAGALLASLLSFVMFWLFFSFHDLFIYYILQPYTSELAAKSKSFTVVQAAVYVLAYVNLNLRDVDPLIYTAIIAAFTLLYVFSGMLCIRKFGERTFHLR